MTHDYASPSLLRRRPPSRVEPLILTYELVSSDLLQFWRYFVRFNPRVQRAMLAGYPIALLFVALIAHAQALGPGGFNAPIWWAGIAVASIGLCAGYPFLVQVYPGVMVRRAAGTRGFLGEHTLEITREEIWHRTSVSEGRYSWRTVRRVVETGAGIYLIFDRQVPIIIPRRAYPDEGEAGLFRQMLEEYRADANALPPEEEEVEVVEASLIPPDAEVVEFELTGRDLRRFVQYHLCCRERGTTCLALVALGCLGAWGLNGGLLGGLLAALAGALAFGVLIPSLLLRHLVATPGVLGQRLMAFSDEGVIGRTEALGEGVLAWHAVDAVAANSEYLYLYYGAASAVVIPNRAFPNSAAAAAFRARCEEWRRTTPRPS